VPFSAERQGDATVIRDAHGAVLWSSTTDFAKPGSTNVTITGALVDEADWPLYDAARWEVFRRLSASQPRLRDGEGGTNGNSTNNPSNMFVSAYSVFANGFPELHVGLQWTNDVTLDIFAFGALHEAVTNEITYTNDENQVITTNVTHWYSVEPGLSGRYDNLWEYVGTVSLTNGDEVVFIDTNYVQERWKVRFYAAFEPGDADNDALNDAFETAILGTSTNSTDSDNDGLSEWDEYYLHRTDPNDEDTDHDGIIDPTELSMGLNPTNNDTDRDGIGDAVDPAPTVSNWWWIVKTSTNLYFRQYIDDLPSWPEYATNDTSWAWTFSTTSPCPGAIVKDVTLSGFVDDAIKVDNHEVLAAWECGTTNLDHVSITNQIDDLQSGQFSLSLWDWPEDGFSGPNEVRIGLTNSEPFVAEWTWWVPMDFRLEHINTNGTPLVVNPSGTRTNREFTCQATVLPTNIPDSSICWSCTNNGMSFVGGVTNGRSVQMVGTELGDWEASVTVLDSTIPQTKLHGTVLEKKTVTVYLHIVRDDNGENAATTVEHFNSLLLGANQIWEQAAIEFQLSSNVVYIDDSEFLVLSSDNDWEEQDLLQAWSSNTGGIEVYCVQQFQGESINGQSYITSNAYAGLSISTNATARTLAHEIGHACGLNDIYDEGELNGVPCSLDVVNISDSYFMQDWCEELPRGGYGNMSLGSMLRRLLMFGEGLVSAVDVPAGGVWGFRANESNAFVNVGLQNMTTREPAHW